MDFIKEHGDRLEFDKKDEIIKNNTRNEEEKEFTKVLLEETQQTLNNQRLKLQDDK